MEVYMKNELKGNSSSIYLSSVFKELSIRHKREMNRATANQNKEIWINAISTEILKLVLDKVKGYNSQNMESLTTEDILKLLNKLNHYYGLELKIRS